MSEKRASLEIIAPSIEEAVAQGLAELGLSEDQVEIEVLDEGTRGFLGLGTRQARVRLIVRDFMPENARSTQDEVLVDHEQGKVEPDAPSTPIVDQRASSEKAALVSGALEAKEPAGKQDEQERIAAIARETVEELLRKMHVHAQVTAAFGEPDDERSKAPLEVDIHGDDLSILIGRRAETLVAMQLIVSMILGKELGHSVPLVLDVEGYRKRRRKQLEGLAQRMAEQAVKTGRTQVLEPMPANERRIVHIALRKHPDVETESIGQEPRRKVTIIPKIQKMEI